MENSNFNNKVANATKWSYITEIAAKLVSPVTNIILVRILVPEAFGVVATITMIISFADMFTDAGFQKYLVQHEFNDEAEKVKNVNVAFWTNLILSFLLMGLIILFSEQIATLVGSPNLGFVIAISSVQLPLTAFSSIQMALYHRDFDFKTLFMVRMVGIAIPFVITIPLALMGLSYWALIIGSVIIQISNAVILTFKSKWKPGFFYDLKILKEMLSFSIWSLLEAISIWFTMWVDAFIIGSVFNQYYLGLYKTAIMMVNSFMTLITGATIPVLYSALSRLQNDHKEFMNMYFITQRMVSVFVFPLGVGVFLYSDLVTAVLLGDQWSEASNVIGVWALTSAIMIVFGYFCSEVFRAKGRPRLSFVVQIIHLIFLVPVCIISAQYGFWPLVYARSLIRFQAIVVDLIIMKYVIAIPVLKTFRNVIPTAVASIAMGFVGFLLKQVSSSYLWSFTSIFICIVFYFGILCLYPTMRRDLFGVVRKLNINRS
ncbi:lipopolysaccharide biosynthesis protein [Acetobacterium bakii]|uniref:Polysaccharide biosynthesis protein n=2 Tax=Acetobacterium bakii TaxID=52689 RepID=A0A0L6U0L0_9FIRM|nr:lipopolysaccharide biosynthesis protein [Acetobacterium bakii]KNZ42043.1 polysaccharide biosynthesis protein [Acetobacterium bakii]